MSKFTIRTSIVVAGLAALVPVIGLTGAAASTGKTATVITTSPVRGTTAPLPNTGV